MNHANPDEYALPDLLRTAPGAVLTIAAVYTAVARVSILFSFQSSRITPIYPAAGLALVAALLLGRRGLLGVWLGAVTTVTISALGHGAGSLPAWLGALGMGLTGGTGAMGGAWLGALLVDRFSEASPPLDSGWNVLVLLVMGALVGGAVSPVVGVLSLSVGGVIPWPSFGPSWLTWWVGDAGGIVVFAPLLLAWARREDRVPDLPLALETAFLVAATALVCYGVFFRNLNYEYGLLPFVLWAAFRFGARGATSVAAAITGFATLGTSLGRGPFARGTVNDSLLHLQLFLLVTVFCALLLAGLLAERIRSERSLADSEASLRSYIDHAPLGVFITDEAGRILQANPAALTLAGFPEGELRTMGVLDLIAAPWRETAAQAFRGLLDQGHASIEVGCVHKDGSPGFWGVEAVRLSATRLMGFASDLSQRRQQEADKARLEAQLQQAQKMDSLGSLAGGVAHDMNNVLAAILATASAQLHSRAEGPQVHRAFDTIAEAATRGGQLVRGLLNFARQQPAEELEVDLNAILRQEVQLLQHTTLAKVRLDLDLEPDLRPIRGDGSALTHALMNLCVNAVDAMDGGGTLTLRTRNLEGDRVEVRVEDEGCGMPAEVLAKALDPFFTTKDIGKGTGLGLSLVYSTVKAHHGELALESEPGRGTRVRLSFPASAAFRQSGAPRPEPAPERGRALKVLVVDDDDLIREASTLLLDTLGHATTVAASGEEALALLAAGDDADVVILDLHMPGLGGLGTLPRLRALRADLPVLLATGRVDESVQQLAKDVPLVFLLPKPYDYKELQSQLKRF